MRTSPGSHGDEGRSLFHARHFQRETRHVDAWVGINMRQWTLGVGAIYDDIDGPEIALSLGVGPVYFGLRISR